jgi:hypothetical protein
MGRTIWWLCPSESFNISGTEPSGPINIDIVIPDINKIQRHKALT